MTAKDELLAQLMRAARNEEENPMTEFREEADADDPLQLAGDIALNAVKAYLEDIIGEDELSIVITISDGKRGAQALTFPDDEVNAEDYERHALMIMLAHAQLTAKHLGWGLELIPMGTFGQG